MSWYYVQSGKREGPIGDSEMHHLISTGAIQPRDLVWRPGLDGWQQAATIPPLLQPPPLPVATLAEAAERVSAGPQPGPPMTALETSIGGVTDLATESASRDLAGANQPTLASEGAPEVGDDAPLWPRVKMVAAIGVFAILFDLIVVSFEHQYRESVIPALAGAIGFCSISWLIGVVAAFSFVRGKGRRRQRFIVFLIVSSAVLIFYAWGDLQRLFGG